MMPGVERIDRVAGTVVAAAAGAMLVAASPPPPAPAPPTLEFAFEETVTLAPAIPVGQTPLGRRNIVPITGGTFAGPGLRGTIIPGGWDWQLTRADGCTAIKADYMLRTDDGVVINVVNAGTGCPGGAPLRTQAVFEAPIGRYDWLGKTAFVGTLELAGTQAAPAVHIRFYRVR